MRAGGRTPSEEARNVQGAVSVAAGTNDTLAGTGTANGGEATTRTDSAGNDASARDEELEQSAAAASEREHLAGGPVPVNEDVLAAVAEGRYHDPHAVLGAHFNPDGSVTIRTLRRFATAVSVRTLNGTFPLEHEWGGIFTGVVPAHDEGKIPDYRVLVTYAGKEPAGSTTPTASRPPWASWTCT